MDFGVGGNEESRGLLIREDENREIVAIESLETAKAATWA